MRRILYAGIFDPFDQQSWSGTNSSIYKALADEFEEVVPFGPLQQAKPFLDRAWAAVERRLTGRATLLEHLPGAAKAMAKCLERKVDEGGFDAVFCPSTLALAHLGGSIPCFSYVDSVFFGIKDYYPYYSNLTNRTIESANTIERAGLHRCGRVFLSSEWARQAAVGEYELPAHRAVVVPFGANLESGFSRQETLEAVSARSIDRLQLLFSAVEWERKGGDIAVEVARQIHDQGIPVQLMVVGLPLPEKHRNLPYVTEVGYLNKSDPADLARLRTLLTESHFMLLPTRADCTPIVFSEAGSFALPVLTTRTGGVPSVVIDGINGQTFALEDAGGGYAKFAAELFRDRPAYQALARSSFERFETDLNWRTVARTLHAEMMEAVGRRVPSLRATAR